MQAFKYPSALSCIKSTFYHEGVLGFYRGILPLLASSTTLRAISWNLYSGGKERVKKIYQDDGVLGAVVPSFVAGGGTGLTMSIFGAPIEFIKVRRQLQKVEEGSAKLKSLGGWIAHVYRQGGFFGLYTGYRIHAPMEILGCGSYFAIYETIKYYGPKTENGTPQHWVSLVGGGISGALSWVLVFPLDVLKSIVQKEAFSGHEKSVSYYFTERYKEFGVRGFFRGMSMQLMRSVPVHAINFYVYENMLHFCTNYK
ncbi:hypothetical protein HDV04_005379 [Boothiomyces sp. JEL0838]|nr:hypothetical protein HDV04_005379 [Boothiomyces sp. JEL0838]